MSDTPLADLQIALSRAVDASHALRSGSVHRPYEALVATYVSQIIDDVVKARSKTEVA